MKLITNLNVSNSKFHKEQTLRNISYLEMKTFLYAYDPDAVYHMRFKSFDMDNLGEPNEAMFVLLDRIISKEISGNYAVQLVTAHADHFGDLIKLVVNKDLRCGVTPTTFNKVHVGAIPMFLVQLAKEVDVNTLKYPLLAQIKYDGVRLIALINEGTVTFKTRNGKIVDLPDLAKAIEALPFDNYILDGEITLQQGTSNERTSVSGMINSAMHGGSIDESILVFNVFDTMSLAEFTTCKGLLPYSSRFAHVNSILYTSEDPRLVVAHTNEVHNPEGALQLYEAVLNLGYEGLILKPHEHYYTFKRSKDWVKVKEVISADLRCTGIIDGTGKYEGMIGALTCEGKVDGKDVVVNVGSGLSDLQRSMPFSEYYGKTIEIKYNSVIQDSKTGQWSLFLPRFTAVRIDK